MIMPLANARDKLTQVCWGIEDFRIRFGREPEGMWLPETAVDLETLDMLAQHGIRFTVLAPSQAKSDGRRGCQRRAASIPTRAYRMKLPSGRSINLFFYDGPISRAVAFEGLLNNGETLRAAAAGRVLRSARLGRSWSTSPPTAKPTAIITAMATWRWPTRSITSSPAVWPRSPTTASFWRRIRPSTKWRFSRTPPGAACTAWGAGAPTAAAIPAATAIGIRNGARRCARRSTGCATRSRPAMKRRPRAIFKDPWAARNDYIDVILDRSPESRERFAAAQLPPQDICSAPIACTSGSCSKCSATPCSCTPVAAGSSTSFPESKPCR